MHLSNLSMITQRVSLSIAIIAMVNGTQQPAPANASADRPLQDPSGPIGEFHAGSSVYAWSPETQGILFSSISYGILLTLIPSGYLAGIFGAKHMLGAGLLASSLLSLCTPLAADLGVSLVMVIRVAQGMAQGMAWTGQFTIWAKWAPPLERSKLTSIAGSGAALGSSLILCVGGLISQALGWPFIFYIFGGLGCVCCLLWFTVIYDDPMGHPCISLREQEHIVSSLAQQVPAPLPAGPAEVMGGAPSTCTPSPPPPPCRGEWGSQHLHPSPGAPAEVGGCSQEGPSDVRIPTWMRCVLSAHVPSTLRPPQGHGPLPAPVGHLLGVLQPLLALHRHRHVPAHLRQLRAARQHQGERGPVRPALRGCLHLHGPGGPAGRLPSVPGPPGAPHRPEALLGPGPPAPVALRRGPALRGFQLHDHRGFADPHSRDQQPVRLGVHHQHLGHRPQVRQLPHGHLPGIRAPRGHHLLHGHRLPHQPGLRVRVEARLLPGCRRQPVRPGVLPHVRAGGAPGLGQREDPHAPLRAPAQTSMWDAGRPLLSVFLLVFTLHVLLFAAGSAGHTSE
uniref:Solute carrier family 17 member 2 n=1 Tax=Myotis myotis TaxID=51298 RepID=A0A7J7STX2_MYOMY|nr:solute carrier family 17 member 2 [Myotis myotis]